MVQSHLMDAYAQAKRIHQLLNEILDLTKQLADAVDRDDKVSIQMLLSMRQTPIGQLKQADRILAEWHASLSSAPLDQEQSTARQPSQILPLLEEQQASNQRLLKQVRALDEAVNRKLTREHSIYNPA